MLRIQVVPENTIGAPDLYPISCMFKPTLNALAMPCQGFDRLHLRALGTAPQWRGSVALAAVCCTTQA